MSGCIVLDCSVLVKLMVWEEDSDAAAKLMERVVQSGLTVVLPAFAWAEVGSVLRHKVRKKEITTEEAGKAWDAFRRLSVITFLDDDQVRNTAWNLSTAENLTTVYEAAYLAVAETVGIGGEPCEFWTADERLVNYLGDKKKYVKLLSREVRGKNQPLVSANENESG